MQKIFVILFAIICSFSMFGQLVTAAHRGKCGYCLEGSKKFIIPPKFDRCSQVNNGLMVVAKNNKEGLIDTLGKTIIGFDYDRLTQNGNLIEATDYKKGMLLYNQKGEKITDDYYQKILIYDPKISIFSVKKIINLD